jgi:hypothetical protein
MGERTLIILAAGLGIVAPLIVALIIAASY